MPSPSQAPQERARLGVLPFVLAGASYIPLIGILFGIITIVWGLCTRRLGGKKLAFIGAGGICFSVVLYGSLFYFGFVQRGGIYDQLRTQMAQNNLNTLVKDIEFYRLSKGSYPDSLADLARSDPKDPMVATLSIDPRNISLSGGFTTFFYRKADTGHYYLRGVAPDGKPFSPGALVPQVPSSGAIGLLTAAPADASQITP
jgi:hypothetical protein